MTTEKTYTTVNDVMRIRTLIEAVEYAASSDSTRYNLTSVFLERGDKPDQVVATATDGHRLAQARAAIEGFPIPTFGVLVDPDAVKALKKFLHKRRRAAISAEVRALPDGFEFLSAPGRTDRPGFTVRSEGDIGFPSYRQVVPRNAGPARLLPREVIGALRELAEVGGRNGNVTVKVREGWLELGAGKEIPGGRILADARFKLEKLAGYADELSDSDFSVNGTYLADALEAVPNAALRAPASALAPMLVEPGRPSEGCEFAVVMPVRK